ncbi:hypothetical protein RJ639_014001 [Escallonia herrerae]|uniref:JmjC domain-containing protein n=1 Tax=Escallonia herrerae TaxID=1293975 RepID=A0AA89AQY1_9ASTE|nr:hypothetical protein RJ639_014001 [Escallonia herrerae]
MEEESLQIRVFEEIPSAEEFASQIEPKNVPAVFNGCIKNWKAFAKWNPSNGGLDYLQERVGSSLVEAMLSKSAPVFNGDIRSHERVLLPFSTFVGYCKELFQNKDDGHDVKQEKHKLAASETEERLLQFADAPQQIYLAQVPIMNTEKEESVQLEILREDIQKPACLKSRAPASVNLWMNNAQTRSSTHYDPHHNLLCVVTGRKRVVLWPPSASPYLYPMPIYGEASNHSAIGVENFDPSIYPRAQHAMEYSQEVVLHAGDALFIPEGWFHQVDSDCVTIAVNFWWRSIIMSDMLDHMDAYYLRRILKRLTDNEMSRIPFERLNDSPSLKDVFSPNTMLRSTSDTVGKKVTNFISQLNDEEAGDRGRNVDGNYCSKGLKGINLKQSIMLHELDPSALKSLHELINIVHDHVNNADPSQPVASTSATDSAGEEKGEAKAIVKENIYHFEDDPVASILWTLEPLTLRTIFLTMAHSFPRTMEALILHLLSPLGAEVLTRKFDEIDQLTVKEDRNKFYQIFYGVFNDQFAAMNVLLTGKESFTLQAFKNVLDQYLGIKFDGPIPSPLYFPLGKARLL